MKPCGIHIVQNNVPTCDNQQMQTSTSCVCAKYLGMHLDQSLTWKKYIFTKHKQLGLKLSQMYWLIGRNFKLFLNNKLPLYKTILKPVWTYGL